MGYLYLAGMAVCGVVMDLSLVPRMDIHDAAFFIVGLGLFSAFAFATISAATRN